jgi:UDP-4-amino-4,6-dideoxy-L-N-acetyl-beta-L-altrosamine transaminase
MTQNSFIPYGKQYIDDEDIQAVVETLKSSYLTTGPKIPEFEQKICEFTGAKFAVAVSNGTAALHLASLCLLEPDDLVLTTPNSFLATANSILYAKAKPIFVDVGADGNIDLELCESALKENPQIKALYGVHFSGNPIDQDKLKHLRETYGLLILEDCAHSIGATFQMRDGEKVSAGSCTHSDLSILSFHPVKHLTTGEGGAITTNDPAYYQKLLKLRNHGMVREPTEYQHPEMAFAADQAANPWYYEMQELGFNYRITDIQCALGISQFRKLEGFLARRKALAARYDTLIQDHPLMTPLYPFNAGSSYHLYVALIDFEQAAVSRSELFAQLVRQNIGLQVHYIPINKQPYYVSLGYGQEPTPRMDHFYQCAVSLPLYPMLTEEEQDKVIRTIQTFL